MRNDRLMINDRGRLTDLWGWFNSGDVRRWRKLLLFDTSTQGLFCPELLLLLQQSLSDPTFNVPMRVQLICFINTLVYILFTLYLFSSSRALFTGDLLTALKGSGLGIVSHGLSDASSLSKPTGDKVSNSRLQRIV